MLLAFRDERLLLTQANGPTTPIAAKTKMLALRLSLLLSAQLATLAQGMSTIASEELQSHELDEFPNAGCYFSAEYQGEFVMQVSSVDWADSFLAESKSIRQHRYERVEPEVQYSTLNITSNAIPVWGYCHKRIDDKVLLRDRQGEYGECIRCLRLARRSRNIIEIFSKDLNRCYTDEAAAIESCKQLNSTSILYRISEVGGVKIRNEYCPIAGKYSIKYSVNYDYNLLKTNSAQSKDECAAFTSDLDNCPNGSLMQLRFRNCSFEDYDMNFECLGSWPVSSSSTGSDAPRYVALLDSRGAFDYSGPDKRRRPRYRCGLYHFDSKTAKTYLTLSSDSGCNQNLFNSTKGYETLILSKITTQKKMPNYVIDNLSTFPQWAQGEWQETVIVNSTMTFNDLNGYKSFTFITVESNETSGRYVVFSRDQCEQEAYICLTMKQRSENVLEFMTGAVSSPVYQSFLCNDTSLTLDRSSAVWWTLSRLERSVESPCPITGEYTGQITDLPGVCAELSSNCNTRQVMYYKVYECNSGELFEERTYLCLGQWEENGVTYTYTMRNDTGTNECFVGTIVNDEEIYIKEAGDYCIRNIDPRKDGMRLYKKGQCYGNSSSPAPTVPTTASPHVPITKITTPIKTVIARTSTTIKSRNGIRGSTITTERMPPNVTSSSPSQYESKATILSIGVTLLIINTLIHILTKNMRFYT